MDYREHASIFECGDDDLLAIFHTPEAEANVGVMILVGGPQYRVGSHRMFVKLARSIAAGGIPAMRFDFRGMGDSDGEFPGFDNLDADIEAAVSCFIRENESVSSVVLLGLCDGATAAALYAQHDSRVSGIILLNPWVHTERAAAQAYIWHYYPRRLMQRDFWNSLFSGQVRVFSAIKDFLAKGKEMAVSSLAEKERGGSTFIDRFEAALYKYRGSILCVTSENDLTAVEFREFISSHSECESFAKIELVNLAGADHTLTEPRCMEDFVRLVLTWLDNLRVDFKN